MSYEIRDEDKLQNEWQLFLHNLNCNHSNQRLVMLEKKIEVYFSNITKIEYFELKLFLCACLNQN